MKTLKALSLSLLAAVALSGTASAVTPTIVHITGSTAFRSQAVAGMIDYLSQGGTVAVHAGFTSGSTLLKAGQQILANGTIATDGSGTATQVVECYWSGSVAGAVDLAIGNPTGVYYDVNSIGAANITAVNGSTVTVNNGTNTTVYGGGVALTSPGTTTLAAEGAFVDHNISWASKALTGATIGSPGSINGYSSIGAIQTALGSSTIIDSGSASDPGGSSGSNAHTDGTVGVVTFEWVLGNINSSGLSAIGTTITNITQEGVKGLISNGYVAQSFLTGTNNAADSANYFYLTGRNEDSGTRVNAFLEGQLPVTVNPKQYSVTGTTLALFPANSALNTEPLLSWPTIGHSGYSSGGNVATALSGATNGTWTFTNGKATNNSGSAFVIGYLGATDAVTAITAGATALTYDGVPYSVAAIQNGQYPFWGYEHLYRLSGEAAALGTIIDGIADKIHDTDADVASNGKHSVLSGDVASGILYDANFNVYKTTEGQPASHF